MSKLIDLVEPRLNRRTFLKAAGALGASAAVGVGGSPLLKKGEQCVNAQAAESDETLIPTWCGMCGPGRNHCYVTCHVKDGRFERVEPNPGLALNQGLCVKGNAAVQYVYSPQRIKYPMKRVGPKGEGAKFERITWDEALDTIAAKLKEIKEKYGAECFGALSPQSFKALSTVGRRFLNIYGTPNYCHSAICATQFTQPAKAITGSVVFRDRTSAPQVDWDKTQLVVMWASNSENAAGAQQLPTNILKAQERGAKLIQIRPMMDPLVAKADVWVPVRPGTDAALMLAIIHTIINENLYDAQFVNEWCHGFDKLKAHVEPFTPEWAEPKCGVPAEQIRNVATMMATIKPAYFNFGNGFEQGNETTFGVHGGLIIAAITGNIGKPGTNMPKLSGLIKTKGVTADDRAPEDAVEKLVAPEYPRWWQKPGSTTSGYYGALKSILTGKPYQMKAICAQGTNPMSATRNPHMVAEALEKVDFYFVVDMYMNSSTPYADIVLPAACEYETSHDFGVITTKEGSWIGIRNKVVEPLGECRSDIQFWLDLGVKMGYGEDFWNGDLEASLDYQLEPAELTAEALRESPRGVFVARAEPLQYEKYDEYFASLPEGKFQCYIQMFEGQSNCQENGILDCLPGFDGPPESLDRTPDIAREYPLIFSDVHAYRLCVHSYMHDIPWLRERQPYPWVRINPDTARQYGIDDGDWVKVESPNGWCKLKAVYFEGLRPDTLMAKRGWWQACEELGLPGYSAFNGGAETNVLYNVDESLFDKFSSSMSKVTLVKISKA